MKKLFVVAILLIFLIAIAFAFILLIKPKQLTSDVVNEKDKNTKSNEELTNSKSGDGKINDYQISTNKNSDSSTSSSGGGSAGGGGGGGGSSGGSSLSDSEGTKNTNCFEEQISYSLRKSEENSTCNEFNGEVCVDKTVKCAVEVTNRDNETTGLFVINFGFFDRSLGEYAQIATSTKEGIVSSSSSENFESTLNLQTEGIDGNANKNIGCTFVTQQVPKKEVCS